MKKTIFLFCLLTGFTGFIKAQNVNIPDVNFKNALLAHNPKIDTNNNGQISVAEATAFTGTIDIYQRGNIANLTGIEAFVNITALDCGGNLLTTLDVSKNTKLILLYCDENQITSLDVTHNTALTLLLCNNNQLTSLNVKNGQNNKITTFNATGNPNLTCIQVDNASASHTGWQKDATASYNTDCNFVYIPDVNFKNYLLSVSTINTNGDTEIQVSEAEAFAGAINCSSKNITNLTGIEAFVNIKQLYCHQNQLTSLNVTQNTALIQLWCYQNQLTSLDVSKNTALTGLQCHQNQLTSLDVTHNTALTQLVCNNNQLTSLDVSKNTALTNLYCQVNQLTSLNLKNGNNPAMTQMWALSNPNLTCIQVDNPSASHTGWQKDATASYSSNCMYPDSEVYIPDANFKEYLVGNSAINTNGDGEIQVSEAEAFTGTIDCSSKNIADLTGIEAFVNITELYCPANQLTNLDVSKNIALLRLLCNENQLTDLDVSKNIALRDLVCNNNPLTALDVSNNTALVQLVCNNTLLTDLDVSENTALGLLFCYGTQLTTLDVSKNAALSILSCYGTQLTDLDVSKNTALSLLACYGNNQLTSLNLKNGNNTSLIYMSAQNNPNLTCIQVDNLDLAYGYTASGFWVKDLTGDYSINCSYSDEEVYIPDDNFKAYLLENSSINTNGDEKITYAEATAFTGTIDCSEKNIADLTGIETFVNITGLKCYTNQLTNLNITKNTALTYLDCADNRLKSLDIRKNTALTYINCCLNQLTSLNVSQNTALTFLSCWSNKLTTLDLSHNTALTTLVCHTINPLRTLNLKNGTNSILSTLLAYNNPNLNCIQVDNFAYVYDQWQKDAGASYSENCDYEVYIPDPNFKAYLLGNSNVNTNGDGKITYAEAAATGIIDCSNLGISDLTGIEAFVNLTQLFCNDNQLTNLDISNNTALQYLYCFNNQLTNLNLKNGNFGLILMRTYNNPSLSCIQVNSIEYALSLTYNSQWIKDATASYNTFCSYIDDEVYIPDANFKAYLLGNSSINTVNDGKITYAEATAFTGTINCNTRNITDLTGIEAFVNITQLYCHQNLLTSLDVSKNTALTSLYCHQNQLTSLDVTQNTALTILYCNQNQLTSLEVTQNTALTTLSCDQNQLTSLDVNKNTALQYLYCFNNQLTNLDVSNNTALTDLYCNNNQLTSLEVTQNTDLIILYCSQNQLTSLDVKNGQNNKITTFNATGNPNLTCIQVDNVANSNSYSNWQKDATASYSEDCSGTLSATNLNKKEIAIYPNPVKEILYFSEEISNVKITDLSGRIVKQISTEGKSVNVANLANGVYIVTATTKAGKVITKKIVKE